jgi:hypothetical protein
VSDQLTAAALAQAARMIGRMMTVASADLLEQLAQIPPSAPRHAPESAHAIDTDIVLEIRHVETRPGRLGETQRVALTVVQVGPLPTTEIMLWDSLPLGSANPYEVGQRFRVKLERL